MSFSGEKSLKRWVFSTHLNKKRLAEQWSSAGRLFQVRRLATVKARSLKVQHLVAGMSSLAVEVERSWWRVATFAQDGCLSTVRLETEVNQQIQLVLDSLAPAWTVQISKQWCNMVRWDAQQCWWKTEYQPRRRLNSHLLWCKMHHPRFCGQTASHGLWWTAIEMETSDTYEFCRKLLIIKQEG